MKAFTARFGKNHPPIAVSSLLAVSNHLLSMRKPKNDVAATPDGPIAAHAVLLHRTFTQEIHAVWLR